MVEGLVQVMPRKGIIVKTVSLDEVMQTMESAASTTEAPARPPRGRPRRAGEMDELTSILARAQNELATRDGERLMRLDREFHGVLAQSAAQSGAHRTARTAARSLASVLDSLAEHAGAII